MSRNRSINTCFKNEIPSFKLNYKQWYRCNRKSWWHKYGQVWCTPFSSKDMEFKS